jgi:hypothetical protein
MRKLLRSVFVQNYDEIVAVVKEQVEMWGELDGGPFNSDPLIEPRLDYLSKRPESSIMDSTEEGDKLHLWVFYSCDGTIRCKEYEDRGPDDPLSTTGFSGGVTFTVQVQLVVDRASGEVVDFEVGDDLHWQKWDNWPQQQAQ